MNLCLRCRKPCEASAVFCEGCRALLRTQLWQEADTLSEAAVQPPSILALSPEGEEEQPWVGNNVDPLERITSPYPIVTPGMAGIAHMFPSPQTPQPVGPHEQQEQYENVVDQAVSRLNEAAERIERVEQQPKRALRAPRASRLAPLPDISSEIRRESTPMPLVMKPSQAQQTPQASQTLQSPPQPPQTPPIEQNEDLAQRIPDLWPWLHDSDSDENENDTWVNRTDPLMTRHFPDSVEIARIEEEDMRRAMAEGLITMPLLPSRKRPRPGTRHLRLAFAVLASLALIALIADSALITFALMHTHRNTPVVNGAPTLTLSSNVANVGQQVTLHINHFSPNTRVQLWHDIEEEVQLTAGSALVGVGADGSASVRMIVDSAWGPGFHTIEAEDTITRYTASATLQIVGAGPTRPSHLLLGATSIDLGADIEGANTIQRLTLQNSGGNSISWSASANQPWLLLSPASGMFSASQTIAIAGERANLKPGDYQGIITFSSNVGAVERLAVSMTVRSLPPNVGPVLQITPPLLSFTALDGGASPSAQLLMISNPGSQPLHWSLASNTPVTLASESLLEPSLNSNNGWLSTDQTSGTVVPHATTYIRVYAQSSNLLPGVYTDVLVFNGDQSVIDNPQDVNVSLTVQPNCALQLSTGGMSFTAVAGQGNPGNHSLSLTETPSCTGTVNWNAVVGPGAANWLAVTPASGQLTGTTGMVTAVSVNTANLKPGTYTNTISFFAKQSTQTLVVQLVVQAPPPPTAPIMGAAPLNLNFSTTQGIPNPPGQVVTVSNTGGGPLYWRTQVQVLGFAWLWATPSAGTIAPNQTAQITVGVNTTSLTPNTYVGQVTIFGTDGKNNTASGSPQTISVSLVVLPPCSLAQPSASSMAFSATAGSGDPSPQTETITASGNCAWPVSWQADTTSKANWLKLTPPSGSFTASGQSATLTVAASIAGLTPGTYSTQVAITATDSGSNPAQGSPQYFTVTLTVLPPCTLQVSNTSFAFTAGQGQPAPAVQTLDLSEIGSCVRPVGWTVTGDSGSSGWLGLSPTSGSDSGSGAAVSVSVTSTTMNPGTYTGNIIVAASGSGGALVQGSPQTITVTLTITGYNVSGTVIACADSQCSSSAPLPGATVTLTNGSGTVVATAISDSSGNYTLTNVATGSYTLAASGSNGTTTFNGSLSSVMVSGNMTGININVYPV